MASGKAPGADSIPAEVFKTGNPQLATKITELLLSMWEQEAVPQDFKDTVIVSIYKRKGSRQCCDNYRGISLLSSAGKIFARVLLN